MKEEKKSPDRQTNNKLQTENIAKYSKGKSETQQNYKITDSDSDLVNN